MKQILFIIAIFGFFTKANAQKSEVAIYLSPLTISEVDNYKVLYRHQLNDDWILRGGLSFTAETDKEIRSDTVALEEGRVHYTIAAGIQRTLDFDGIDGIALYVGADMYYDSEFNKKSYENYYGYYWNFGLNPIVGISYEPFEHIRLSVESLGDANVNLQQYSAIGVNQDERFRFSLVDRLAIAIGYTFN